MMRGQQQQRDDCRQARHIGKDNVAESSLMGAPVAAPAAAVTSGGSSVVAIELIIDSGTAGPSFATPATTLSKDRLA